MCGISIRTFPLSIVGAWQPPKEKKKIRYILSCRVTLGVCLGTTVERQPEYWSRSTVVGISSCCFACAHATGAAPATVLLLSVSPCLHCPEYCIYFGTTKNRSYDGSSVRGGEMTNQLHDFGRRYRGSVNRSRGKQFSAAQNERSQEEQSQEAACALCNGISAVSTHLFA